MTERIWELLAKYWAERISSEEKAELERLLLEHPDNWLKTGLMQQINWGLIPVLSSKKLNKIADGIVGERLEEPRRGNEATGWSQQGNLRSTRSFFAHRLKPAIAILLLLGLAGLSFIRWPRTRVEDNLVWQQVTTINGMRTSLRLADGTIIWLNAGSNLRYPESFNDTTREIYLSGEAYIKVKQDVQRSFIIHTADMDVKILGTTLDVRAYTDESYSKTTLISGVAEVTVNRDKQKQQIYLKPHQKITVQKTAMPDKGTAPPQKSIIRDVVLEPLSLVEGHIIPETAWMENKLVFEHEPLYSLARRLERWYGINIVIEDSSFAWQRFTGNTDNASLEGCLQILQMLKPFEFSIQGKQVIIQ